MKGLRRIKTKSFPKKIYTDVSVERIRYSDETCYVREGFGGKPIRESPLHGFFFDYVHGDPDGAFNDFCDWYQEQFERYRQVGKKYGGMHKGSLYQLVERLQREESGDDSDELLEFDPDVVRQGIRKRVRQRLNLVDAILKEGYIPEASDPVRAVRHGRNFILIDGHHRVCSLSALGYSSVPELIAWRHRFVRRMYEKPFRKWFVSENRLPDHVIAVIK